MSAAVSSKASDAAERSQGVYFANLKEDMLLQKNLHVFGRAEKSLVHRIAIDQKIIFRRFQAKLRRSKIAIARLWDDKDEERELRARDLHVMNTNCGQEQNDFEFLKKLERRPCLVDGDVTETEKPVQAEGPPSVTDEDTEELIRAIMHEHALVPNEKNLLSLSAIGHLMDEAQLAPGTQDSDLISRRTVTKSATRGLRPPPSVTVRPVTAPGSKPSGITTATLNHEASRIGTKQRQEQHWPPVPRTVKAPSDHREKKQGYRRRPQTSPPPSHKTSNQKKPLGITRKTKIRPQSSLGLNQLSGKSRVSASQSAQNAASSRYTTNSRAKSARATSTSIRGSSADVKTKAGAGVQSSSSSADPRTKSASVVRNKSTDTRVKPDAGALTGPADSSIKSASGVQRSSADTMRTKSISASGARTGTADSRMKSASGVHSSPVDTERIKPGSANTERTKPISGVHRSSADTRTKRAHRVHVSSEEVITRTQSPYEDPPYTLSPRASTTTGKRHSIRGGSVGDESQSQPASPSMFEEQKKIDWVALRLEEARNYDPTPKVSAFLKTLLDLDKKDRLLAGPPREEFYVAPESEGPPLAPTDPEAEMVKTQTRDVADQGENEEEERKTEELKGDRKFDYYATKMALQAASVKRDRMMSLPGTPEEVNMKLVGDNTIKSITMPRLIVDYSDVTQGVGEEDEDVEDRPTSAKMNIKA